LTDPLVEIDGRPCVEAAVQRGHRELVSRTLSLLVCLTGCSPDAPATELPPSQPSAEEAGQPVLPPQAEAPAAPASPQPRVTKEGGILRVSPHAADCPSIRLHLVRASLEMRRCKGRRWARQVQTLRELLLAAQKHRGSDWALKRLTMGADRYAYPGLSERLVAVTKKRRHRGGKVTPKDLNDLVLQVANEQRLYGEVIEIMAAVGLSPTMKWVEKCNRAGCAQARYELTPIAAAGTRP